MNLVNSLWKPLFCQPLHLQYLQYSNAKISYRFVRIVRLIEMLKVEVLIFLQLVSKTDVSIYRVNEKLQTIENLDKSGSSLSQTGIR